MSTHEQFADDLALYAVGALAGEDRAAMETHLVGCSAWRVGMDHLRGDGALLALSTLGPKPPQRARQRLLDAVAKEPRVPVKVTRTEARRPWWGVLGWAATAAVIVFAASLWRGEFFLQGAFAAGGLAGGAGGGGNEESG